MSSTGFARDDYLAQHLARVPVHRALIRALEHRLFAQETLEHPALDIGCGDGHYAAAAFPAGIDAGIDISWPIVAEGRTNGPYRHVAVADGTRLPFCSESFRTIVSNCVIEHIPDIEGLVSEVSRLLVPGGRFIFSVPNDSFTGSLFTVRQLRRLRLNGLAETYGRWWNNHAAHHHLDAQSTWTERLARHGLTVDRHAYYMSPEATAAFELSHYYAVPSLVWHRVTRRWSLRPEQARKALSHHWLHGYAEEAEPAAGACSFYVTHKG